MINCTHLTKLAWRIIWLKLGKGENVCDDCALAAFKQGAILA